MRNNGFVSFVLFILTVFIFSISVFFCLDVFEIVDVPEKYSIAKLFSTTMEEIAVAEPIEKIIPSRDKNNDEIIVILDPKQEDEIKPPDFSQYEQPEKPSGSNKFYYNQLDEYGKMIYDRLGENKSRLKTGTYTAQFDTTFNDLLHQEDGNEILNRAFQLSINAFTFDNPDIFYIDVTKMYLFTEITTTIFKKTYRISIGNIEGENYLHSEFPTEGAVNEAIEKVNQEKELIKSKIRTSSEESKMKIVHDYFVDTIEYDISLSRPNIYNTYGALINKLAVCEGYARGFKYILDDLGIPCIIVCGIARDKQGNVENHAWNYVYLNDQWYAIDVTWDNPIIIGGNGTKPLRDEIRYAYYLKGSNSFFEDHTEDGRILADSNFIYPRLSNIDWK